MNKKLLSIAVILLLGFIGCSKNVDNSFTFNNMSDGDIFVNFRGSIISVASGKTVVIKNIPQGTYTYATTFAVPANATSSTSQGNVSGSVVMNAGTKIQILYSSTILSGTYTLYATISNSDDQSANSTSVTAP